jgi:hypothetical protein
LEQTGSSRPISGTTGSRHACFRPLGTLFSYARPINGLKWHGAVWRQDTVGNPMPVACHDREKAMPDARWCARIRGTQGAAQRQLQAWPLHRRDDRLSSVAKGADSRSEGIDQETASALRSGCRRDPANASRGGGGPEGHALRGRRLSRARRRPTSCRKRRASAGGGRTGRQDPCGRRYLMSRLHATT